MSFDLKKYLAENRLLQEEFISEVSDSEIEAAAAKALGVSPEELEKEEGKIEEVGLALAVTIAGLIPPALELVGGVTNKAKQLIGLNDQEKKELADLNAKIKKSKGLVDTFDDENIGSNDKEKRAIELLKNLKDERDEKFGTKFGNWAKHAGHKLHHAYVTPIRKMFEYAAKFSKKDSKLRDKDYREKLSNIVYAAVMMGIAGVGIASHIGHLHGVGPVLTTLADGVKEGKSIVDLVKGIASLI
ncbi:MAG: hypothetical protein GY793_07245 [Proteobacteria bacterium]|nr:hypothetical protein [Alteromonadales bacterium]MCP4355415.1 hypothetical protein [Pseudomonadota bacterium]